MLRTSKPPLTPALRSPVGVLLMQSKVVCIATIDLELWFSTTSSHICLDLLNWGGYSFTLVICAETLNVSRDAVSTTSGKALISPLPGKTSHNRVNGTPIFSAKQRNFSACEEHCCNQALALSDHGQSANTHPQ